VTPRVALQTRAFRGERHRIVARQSASAATGRMLVPAALAAAKRIA
jgi:hypothetical protein